jgi:DNA polymerase I
LGLALWRVEDSLKRILSDLNCSDFNIYLSGSDNFRYNIFPEYKANRRGKPIPRHLTACKEFLVTNFGADVTHGYEADDAIGMAQRADGSTTCVSIDKDLKQLAGQHYNFVKQDLFYIPENTANRYFWEQMLVGDTSDNIKGITGIGKVKAERILNNSDNYQRSILSEYLHQSTYQSYQLNGQLLWIWRKPNDSWVGAH